MSKLCQVKYDIGQKVSYKKPIFDTVDGVYQKIRDDTKEGYVFCIMIDVDSIRYKVHHSRTGLKFGWDEVIQSKIIESEVKDDEQRTD